MRDKFIRKANESPVINYANHKNTDFPTISILQNNSDMIGADNIDTMNLMTIVVGFFESVLVEIERLFDDNGVPDDCWMLGDVPFHGYTTAYEASRNNSKEELFDGLVEYSAVQDIVYALNTGYGRKIDFSYMCRWIKEDCRYNEQGIEF